VARRLYEQVGFRLRETGIEAEDEVFMYLALRAVGYLMRGGERPFMTNFIQLERVERQGAAPRSAAPRASFDIRCSGSLQGSLVVRAVFSDSLTPSLAMVALSA
jgi:hypothetical protein